MTLARRAIPALVGLAVLVVQVVNWLPAHIARTDTDNLDFPIYQRAAQHLAAGEPVYTPAPRADLRLPPNAFLYPPPFVAAVRPFARLAPRAFQTFAYLLLFAAFWVCAAGLARIAWARPGLPEVLTAGAILQLLTDVAWTMSFGNAELVVWALVVWAFAAPRFAPTLLVLGAALKLYPLAPLLVLLLHRPRQRAQAAGAAIAVLAATLLVVGPGVFRQWWTVGLPALSAGVFSSRNISLVTAELRPCHFDMARPLPPAAQAFLRWGPAAHVALATALVWRAPVAMGAAIVLVVAVLAAPICWTHQAALVVIPLALWFRARVSARSDGQPAAAVTDPGSATPG